jgi:hypothetical protein
MGKPSAPARLPGKNFVQTNFFPPKTGAMVVI